MARREAVRSLYIVKIEIIKDQRVMGEQVKRTTWLTEVERKASN